MGGIFEEGGSDGESGSRLSFSGRNSQREEYRSRFRFDARRASYYPSALGAGMLDACHFVREEYHAAPSKIVEFRCQ